MIARLLSFPPISLNLLKAGDFLTFRNVIYTLTATPGFLGIYRIILYYVCVRVYYASISPAASACASMLEKPTSCCELDLGIDASCFFVDGADIEKKRGKEINGCISIIWGWEAYAKKKKSRE